MSTILNFFVLGVNHKDCPIAMREKLHFTSAMISKVLKTFAGRSSIAELLILPTCNRVEFYGTAKVLQEAREEMIAYVESSCGVSRSQFESYLYFHEERQAIAHLFRVACGLDSLVIGENEILGQLRDAFRAANEWRSVHTLLYRLVEKALKVGKEVRTKTKINEGAISIPSVAVELAEKIFGRLSGEKVVVIGTGEMASLTMSNLKNAGANIAYVVSRAQETGAQVAMEFDAEWAPLHSWQKAIKEVDILITSTAAPHTLIGSQQIKEVMQQRHNRPLFLIDISVPRNIEPRVNTIDDVYLYNVDDLKSVSSANMRLRQREIQQAEELVKEAVLSFRSYLEQLTARPTLERYEQFLEEVLEKEFSAESLSLNSEQKKEIQNRIRAKLMHPPLEKIKEASRNGGVIRYLEALHALFKLDDSPKEKE